MTETIAPESAKPARWALGWWPPTLITFISSSCVMILELVASRLIAPYVGVSLYTWTSVIGVVLAGMSIGNYIGGRLADRWASRYLLGGAFLLAGLCSFGALAVDGLAKQMPTDWPIIIQIMLLTAGLFLIPSLVLGTISPILVKLAVRDLAKTGSTVGRIYAAGTVGSIAGTFATGFWLISWFGTHTIIWAVGGLLVLLGLALIVGRRWPVMAAAVVALGAGSWFANGQGWLQSICDRETNYFCIRVVEQTRDGAPVRALILDRMVHSHSSLDDPTKLVYDYERMYAEVTAHRAAQDDHLRALFIGGGGYTFPRYMATIYPGSDVDVIEIDPEVTEVAYEELGVRRDAKITNYNEDGRMVLSREPSQTYDLIYGDAFNDFSVPYHLTTHEFNQRVQAWLAEDGLYVINMIDGAQARFLRAFVETLRQTFPYVYVAPTDFEWKQLSRNTFVIVASGQPVAVDAIGAGSDRRFASHLLSAADLDAVLAAGKVVILTDRYAPVDQMLAPVFRDVVGE